MKNVSSLTLEHYKKIDEEVKKFVDFDPFISDRLDEIHYRFLDDNAGIEPICTQEEYSIQKKIVDCGYPSPLDLTLLGRFMYSIGMLQAFRNGSFIDAKLRFWHPLVLILALPWIIFVGLANTFLHGWSNTKEEWTKSRFLLGFPKFFRDSPEKLVLFSKKEVKWLEHIGKLLREERINVSKERG